MRKESNANRLRLGSTGESVLRFMLQLQMVIWM
jgi:hypothetical protein